MTDQLKPHSQAERGLTVNNLKRILSYPAETIVRHKSTGTEFSVAEIIKMLWDAGSPEEAEKLCETFDVVDVGPLTESPTKKKESMKQETRANLNEAKQAIYNAMNVIGATFPSGEIDNNALAADAMEAIFGIENPDSRKILQATAVRLRQMDALVRRMVEAKETAIPLLRDSANLIDGELKTDKTD